MRRTLISTVFLIGLTGCVSDQTPDPAEDQSNATSQQKTQPTSQPSKPPAKTPPAKTEPKPLEVGHVDAAGAAKLIADEPEAVILDVRTPREFAGGHIAGAVNIDYKADDFATKLGALDKTKKYLVHCRSGGRSTNALPKFKELGFQSVVHLDGGMLAWESAKLPVVK